MFIEISKNFFYKSCHKLCPLSEYVKKRIEKKYARKKVVRIIMKFNIGVQKKILRLFGNEQETVYFVKHLYTIDAFLKKHSKVFDIKNLIYTLLISFTLIDLFDGTSQCHSKRVMFIGMHA